jgi:hypothetical protein
MLVNFSSLRQKAWHNHLRKDLFWLMVSEDSVQSQLASLLWDWGKARASLQRGHGGTELHISFHGSQEAERERGQGKIYPLKTCPQWPTSSNNPTLNNVILLWIHQWISPLIRSEPLWSNHFPKAHELVANPLTHAPFRGHFIPKP